jgi:hypothetical protein
VVKVPVREIKEAPDRQAPEVGTGVKQFRMMGVGIGVGVGVSGKGVGVEVGLGVAVLQKGVGIGIGVSTGPIGKFFPQPTKGIAAATDNKTKTWIVFKG